MDKEGMLIDIADALGKSAAAVSVIGAMGAMLVAKGLLSEEDLATISAIAGQSVEQMEGLPDDARELARACLRGFAKAWTQRIARN